MQKQFPVWKTLLVMFPSSLDQSWFIRCITLCKKIEVNILKIHVIPSITKFRQLFLILCVDLVQVLHVSKTGQPQFSHTGLDITIHHGV